MTFLGVESAYDSKLKYQASGVTGASCVTLASCPHPDLGAMGSSWQLLKFLCLFVPPLYY